MRNRAGGAILDSTLYVKEISAAFISERKKRTTAKHTIKVVTLNLVARKIFTFCIFKVFTAVFHNFSPFCYRTANLNFLNVTAAALMLSFFKRAPKTVHRAV